MTVSVSADLTNEEQCQRLVDRAVQEFGRIDIPGASIINTSSIQASQPSPELLDYATTKAGIVNFSGEHVLRFEAITHNTKQLRCGRVLDRFGDIIQRLAEMVDRFATTLGCVDTTFIGDQLLDQLPLPTQIGQTRVGGVDLNKSRIRAALSATLALSVAPSGFIVAEFTTKVHTMTGQTDSDYTSRQALTTCANCVANSSWSNPTEPAATRPRPTPPP